MNEFIKSKIETKPVPFEFDKTNKYRNGFFLLSHGKLQVNNGLYYRMKYTVYYIRFNLYSLKRV